MSFRGLLRPGQGFQCFHILRTVGATTKTGRARTARLEATEELWGILTDATPKEIDQFKQRGTPITHTILQRGTESSAKANDILELRNEEEGKTRTFIVKGDPKNPGDLGHFLIYYVEERKDLQ